MSGRWVPPRNGSFSITTSPGCRLEALDRRLHRHWHRAQMHGHVIAHGDDLAAGIENRTGVIPPLFYVGRKCGAAQRRAHLLGNGVVDVLEDFQFDGIASHAKTNWQGSDVSQSLPVYDNVPVAPSPGQCFRFFCGFLCGMTRRRQEYSRIMVVPDARSC